MTTQLRLRDLSVRFANRTSPVLSGVELSVGAGECHCIVGPTGSGKSTLLHSIAGLLFPESWTGTIETDTRPGAVFQNPHTQILCDHVGPETAFALENQSTPPEQMPSLVAKALIAAGLDVPTNTTTESLSMGRKYRLVLAGALVTTPGLLLLDEPCAQLDPQGTEAVAQVIDKLLKDGGSVILCEHQPEALNSRITHWWRIEDGQLRPSSSQQHNTPTASETEMTTRQLTPAGDKTLLNLSDIFLSFGDKSVFRSLDFSLSSGECVHVEGVNGSGKSTLTRIMTGFLEPDSGEATLFGAPLSPDKLRGRVGLVLQNPVSQLFEDTVSRELAFAARRKRLDQPEKRAHTMAETLGIADLLDRPPCLLSYGQQRLVALGSCLTQEPELLLLDDPFAGLDRKARQRVRSLLAQEREERGMAVLVTGHNPPSPLRFNNFYHRELRISGGRLVPVA